MGTKKRPQGRLPERARGKQAIATPAAKDSKERLSWRLASVDLDGPWSWRKATAADLALIHAKVRDFETMTADELFGPNSGRHKHIPVGNLPARARRRLAELELDDLDDLFELGLGGKPRLWGFRQNSAIHVLWWDPEHTVFPG